jgi:hypothetical protein
MYSAVVFLARIIMGSAALLFIWLVFDRIQDRNTEILAAIAGLQYSFIFLISRRLEYFGLSIFSFFGRTASYIQKLPYDQVLREEVGIDSHSRHLYLNVIFAGLIELLCVFRLFTSLLGHGWRALSDPINRLLVPPF